jgi:hypothetical protein
MLAGGSPATNDGRSNLAFGLDDDGNSSFYFHLGNPFELRRR